MKHAHTVPGTPRLIHDAGLIVTARLIITRVRRHMLRVNIRPSIGVTMRNQLRSINETYAHRRGNDCCVHWQSHASRVDVETSLTILPLRAQLFLRQLVPLPLTGAREL